MSTTAPHILVLNAGSSSLKASLVAVPDVTLTRAELSWGLDSVRRSDLDTVVRDVLRTVGLDTDDIGDPQATAASGLVAVGHRIVHGGSRFTATVPIDDAIVDAIRSVADLAPLHNARAIDTIEVARRLLPSVPHTASFDTAFHATLPPQAYRYAVPERWYRDWGIRRYGFHGLSVSWSVGRAASLLQRETSDLSLVVAHLGGGCSVTAVHAGRSIHTSMGLTPLEGLMMGSRSGSIDPSIPLQLVERGLLDITEVRDELEHASGLLGVSGVSADMRTVQAAAHEGNEAARLAVTMFVGRVASGIAAAATALPRIDALVFTGGIGEHAREVRSAIVSHLAILGIAPLTEIDDGGDHEYISGREDPIPILCVEAREDLVIAAESAALVRA